MAETPQQATKHPQPQKKDKPPKKQNKIHTEAHNYRFKKHTAVVQCPLAQLNGASNYAWCHAKTSYQKETRVTHVLITM